MQLTHFLKAAIFAFTVIVVCVGSWEMYLRSKGVSFSFDDDEALWAYKRSQIYDEQERATFFIGSSRIKFDVDLMTWQKITGEKAVQLALVGTSPQLILKNLANDKKFRGKLLVDGTEFILFSRDPGDRENAEKSIKYYKNLTPTQRGSFYINYVLQSNLVFLESRKFSLNAFLNQIPVTNRKGIFSFSGFPLGFEPTTFERQNIMSEDFIKDTTRQQRVKEIWTRGGLLSRTLGPTGDSLQKIFTDLKTSIDKITERGGQVIFIRPPSSGEVREAEKIAYPRQMFWDKLLTYTKTPGIYYADYPATANFVCPEWSHLAPKDAIVYTENLVRILETEKGWKFKNSPNH